MNTMKRKGFTLVELLVVIAILAILATVSVVGYTSFIERAHVSNDQTMADQLNSFLTALKADSDGEYYEELKGDITADNVTEITNHILIESGANSLLPEAENYGYHFYFDLDEQKYVVLHDDDAIDVPSGVDIFLKPTAADKLGLNSLSASNCFTKDGRYCLVDTESNWGKLIGRYNEVTSLEDLQSLYDEAQAMTTEKNVAIPGFAFLIETTTFITENGNLVVKVDSTHHTFVVQKEASEKEDGTKNVYNLAGTMADLFDNDVTISVSNPLFTPDDSEREYVIELPEDVAYISPNFANVPNPDKTVTNEDGTTSDVPTYVVVIVINKETAEEIEKIVEVGMDSNGVKLENSTGEDVTVTDTQIIVGDETLEIKEKNTVVDFKISVSNSNQNKVNAAESSAHIAWDGKTFTLSASDFKSSVAGQTVSSQAVSWTLVSATGADNAVDYSKYVSLADGVLTLKADETTGLAPEINEIVVKATAASGGHEETYTLKVVRVTGVSGLKLGTESVQFGTEIALGTGSTATPYTLSTSGAVYNYNHSNHGVTLNQTATLVANETFIVAADGLTFTLKSGDELTTAKELAVKIGDYYSNNLLISMYNTDALTFRVNTNSSKIKFVGDANAITIADLFVHNTSMDIPDDAQVWFMKDFADTITKPGIVSATGFSPSGDDDNSEDMLMKVELNDGNDWGNTEIQFQKGGTYAEHPTVQVIIVIPYGTDADGKAQYRCISEVRTVEIVAAKNIKTWADLAGTADTPVASTNTSIVFLNDITMPLIEGEVTYNTSVIGGSATMTAPLGELNISGGATLYGNYFTFDITNGLITGQEGIITVIGGHLRDVKIVGRVYPEFGPRVGMKWGTNAVKAQDGATITNCYISNTRAPIRVSGNVTIEDTVFFGGRYANICATNGTTTLKGNVITINQPYNNPNDDVPNSVVGVGISIWYEHSNTITIEGTLTQYNFISGNEYDNLPSVSTGLTSVNLGEVFGSLFVEEGDEVIGKKPCVINHDHGEGTSCCSKEESAGTTDDCGNTTGGHTHDGTDCALEDDYGLKYDEYIFNKVENGEVVDMYMNAGYVDINGVDPTISSIDGYGGAKTKVSGRDVSVYAPLDNDANQNLFKAAMEAVNKYSNWDFDESGNIIH